MPAADPAKTCSRLTPRKRWPEMAQTITSAGVTYTICPECEYAHSGPECPRCRDEKFGFFYDQLAGVETTLEELGAVIEVGGRQYVDTSRVPAPRKAIGPDLLSTYKGLLAFGYANGLL